MRELFDSGKLVDFILILVIAEAILIAGYWRITGRGIRAADLLPNLIAGASLLLALRVTLAGQGWLWACGCLAAAGIAHSADIVRRWRG